MALGSRRRVARWLCTDLWRLQLDGYFRFSVVAPFVVPLFAGAFAGTDSASDCVSGVSEELIKAIRHDPAIYYVNVHSSVFPAGAIRGQLGK